MDTLNKNQMLVNGNEAAALAALAAKIDYFTHYPGSPVNMLEPAIKKYKKEYHYDMFIHDALNEHVAALAAAGASYCGARSMVVMKHVGMNIAADPFNYIGYTGVKGGMVIIVGTDPGANCSTGEQDTHWYVPQINFPLFEPTSIMEIYTHVQTAFDISEIYHIPVLIFMPARLCYNYDLIEVPANITSHHQRKIFYFEKDDKRYINVGKRAIRNHRRLIQKIDQIAESEKHEKSFFNSKAEIGLITRGMTFGHAFEAVQRFGITQKVHLINLDLVYPLNKQSIKEFCKNKTEVIFIEDQDGFLEYQVKMELFNDLKCKIIGKNYFPKYDEIKFEQVSGFLVDRFDIRIKKDESRDFRINDIPERLGAFCEGCPHRAAYFGIDRALEGRDGIIGGDIGCSSLPPFRADWLLCMNAGIGISQGMAHILKNQIVISTGGDGSFFHAGLLSLLSAINNGVDLLHVVFDNRNIAMTGHQPSATSHPGLNYKKLLKSIGVNRVAEVNAKSPRTLMKRLKIEMQKPGVKVIWVKGDCVQVPSKFKKLIRNTRVLKIDYKKCGSCSECYNDLGCPAIRYEKKDINKLKIDEKRCMRCGACIDVCMKGAIDASFNCTMSEAMDQTMELMKSKLPK